MWKAAQVTVQGRGHKIADKPCQDKTYILDSPPDCFVVSLADGAGSAEYSELGAQCVTQKICRVLNENFTRYFATEESGSVAEEILSFLVEDLKNLAAETDCEIRALASTLLAVAVKGKQFIGVHIGDGVIGVLDENFLAVMSHPDNGEFINETIFVTSSNAISHLRLYKGELEEISAFVLMSDGTAEGMYQRDTQNFMPIVEKLIKAAKLLPPHEVEAELKANFQETLCKVTADDCSLILLVKEPYDSE